MHGLLWLLWTAAPGWCLGGEAPALVRIPVTGNPAQVSLPVYAHAQDAAGGEYVLAKASLPELAAAGWPLMVCCGISPDDGPPPVIAALERR